MLLSLIHVVAFSSPSLVCVITLSSPSLVSLAYPLPLPLAPSLEFTKHCLIVEYWGGDENPLFDVVYVKNGIYFNTECVAAISKIASTCISYTASHLSLPSNNQLSSLSHSHG